MNLIFCINNTLIVTCVLGLQCLAMSSLHLGHDLDVYYLKTLCMTLINTVIENYNVSSPLKTI